MSKSRKRVRNSESSESTSNEGPSGDEIPELDTLLRPKKRRKVNQTAANKKPDTSGGKKHVKEFFGIDPSKIRQRIPQAEFEDYESIDDEPRKRTAVRYASSDEDEMEYEEEQENVPTPSKDEPVVLSSEMLQSRLEMAKYIIDGDGTDIGLYNIFVSPRDVEEVIKTAFLDDAEYQLTPTGLIDYATVKGKQIVLQTSGAVSVGEGSLSGNEPNFNLSDPMQYLSAKQAANLRLFLRAHKLIFMLNYYKYEVDHVKQLFERWQRARFACQQAYEFARSQVMWIRCKWETFDPNRYMNAVDFYMERMSFHIGETRETINKMKKRGGAAQIAEYISIHLQMEDLRRNPSGTVLYQQLMQQNGKPTFTWHPYKTLSQYVIDKCYPDSQLYSSLTENPGTLSAVTGILAPDGIKGANSPEHPCLPIVRMNRYLFAYRNGVYDTKANKFYDNPARCPHQNLTACRFFDAEFNNKWLDPTFNWRDIETPNIESIMKHQEFDVQGKRAEEEALRRAGKTPSKDNEKAKKNDQQTKEDFSKSSTKARMQMSEDQQAMYRQLDDWHADPHSLIDWIYGFGGRMLYDQAEIDRWEKMFFLLGWAGTGKSTFGQVFAAFYPAEKIAIVGNRTETTFGLEALETSFMNIAFDINHNFTFDICDWKSIVSGEPVQVKKKNKVACTVKLPGSWLVICNILPNWSDEQGSMTRRMALLRFTKPVPTDKTDTNLLNKIINDELPFLLVKCNLAYHEKRRQVGDEDVRCHWSYYFDKSMQDIDNECNAFEAFLKSEQIVTPSKTEDCQIYKNTYIPDTKLKAAFHAFCRKQKLGHIPWNSEEVEPKLVSGLVLTFSTGRDIVRFESVALPYTRKDPSNINWETFDKQNAAPNAEKLIYWRGIDLLSNISVDEQSYYRQKSQHGEKQNIPPTSLIQE